MDGKNDDLLRNQSKTGFNAEISQKLHFDTFSLFLQAY